MLGIEAQVEKFTSLANLPEDHRRELDIIGTALWNACGPGTTTRFGDRENQKILSRGVSRCDRYFGRAWYNGQH